MAAKVDPRGSAWIRVIVGSWIRIRILILLKSWIRIRIKDNMEPWRAVDAQNGDLEGQNRAVEGL